VSLLEMLAKFSVADFNFLLMELDSIQDATIEEEKKLHSEMTDLTGEAIFKAIWRRPISDDLKNEWEGLLNRIEAVCKTIELESALDQIERMKALLGFGGIAFPHKEIVDDARQLKTRINERLGKRTFLYVPLANANHYDREALFGAEVAERFPEANKEIREAGNCYATGNYTACVFHLMRGVEIGAKAMVFRMKAQKYIGKDEFVKGVKVFKKKPVELCDWSMLIGGLRRALKELEKGTASDPRKKARHAFFSEAVEAFSLFKDAWRNKISHGHDVAPERKLFLEGETTDIMKSTERFMRHLAQRVKERL
jgi:hypothetical protein